MSAAAVPAWSGPYVGRAYDADKFNCWSLVRLVLSERCGIELPAYGETDARNLIAVGRAIRDGRRAGDWQPVVGARRTFDVVLMRGPLEPGDRAGTLRRANVHCGVMVSPRHLLHIFEATDSVIVPLDHPQVRTRISETWRHRSLAGGNE